MIPIKKKQFITTENGTRTGVLLDISTYAKMMEDLEELESIREYDIAKPGIDRAMKNGDFVTVDEYAAGKQKEEKSGALSRRHSKTRSKRTR